MGEDTSCYQQLHYSKRATTGQIVENTYFLDGSGPSTGYVSPPNRRLSWCSSKTSVGGEVSPHSLRTLFLKTSRVKGYLTGIQPNEVPTLEFGSFPAVEPLALAVTAVRLERGTKDDDEDDMALANSYAVPELLRRFFSPNGDCRPDGSHDNSLARHVAAEPPLGYY